MPDVNDAPLAINLLNTRLMLQEEIKWLEKRYKDLIPFLKKDTLASEIADLEKKKNSIAEDIALHQFELDVVKTEITDIKQTLEIEKEKAKRELEAEVRSLEDKKKIAGNAYYDSKRKEADELIKTVKAEAEKIRDKENKKIQDLKNEYTLLDTEYKSKKEQYHQFLTVWDEQKAKLKADIDAFQIEKDRLSASLADFELEKQSFEKEKGEFQTQINKEKILLNEQKSQLDDSLKLLENEKELLKQKSIELDKASAANEELRSELERQKSQYIQWQKDLNDKDMEIKSRLVDVEKRARDLEINWNEYVKAKKKLDWQLRELRQFKK
jgi:chromosome segregation ATPase